MLGRGPSSGLSIVRLPSLTFAGKSPLGPVCVAAFGAARACPRPSDDSARRDWEISGHARPKGSADGNRFRTQGAFFDQNCPLLPSKLVVRTATNLERALALTLVLSPLVACAGEQGSSSRSASRANGGAGSLTC